MRYAFHLIIGATGACHAHPTLGRRQTCSEAKNTQALSELLALECKIIIGVSNITVMVMKVEAGKFFIIGQVK